MLALALPFSVLIQHSDAARVRVIGGSGGFSGSAGFAGDDNAAKGPGELPSVSQPARSPAAAKAKTRAAALQVRACEDFMVAFPNDAGRPA